MTHLFLSAETVLPGAVGVECKIESPMHDDATVAACLDLLCSFVDILPIVADEKKEI